MIYRHAWLLLILFDFSCSGIARAQEPACANLTAKVIPTRANRATSSWNIFLENRGNSKVRIRTPESRLKWKIEERTIDGSNEVVSGGVGQGHPSAGSTSKLTGRTRVLGSGRKLLAIRFDLRRDTEAADALLENHEYSIVFDFDVGLFRNGNQSTACHLATDAQKFTIMR
jgi:hypothetical protein